MVSFVVAFTKDRLPKLDELVGGLVVLVVAVAIHNASVILGVVVGVVVPVVVVFVAFAHDFAFDVDVGIGKGSVQGAVVDGHVQPLQWQAKQFPQVHHEQKSEGEEDGKKRIGRKDL